MPVISVLVKCPVKFSAYEWGLAQYLLPNRPAPILCILIFLAGAHGQQNNVRNIPLPQQDKSPITGAFVSSSTLDQS